MAITTTNPTILSPSSPLSTSSPSSHYSPTTTPTPTLPLMANHSSNSPHPSSAQQVHGLPTPSMQNHMHELAKTLPPPRRQNIACDACRARKVRCHQVPGQDKCQHCQSKNYPCTHFVQQATTEKKRQAGVNRRPRALSTQPNGTSQSNHIVPSHTSDTSNTSRRGSPSQYRPYGTQHSLSLPYQLPNSRSTPQSATLQLLAYLFSSEGPTDPASYSASSRGRTPVYNDWGELSKHLEKEVNRIEFAFELVEVFFQICHTRLPLLNPAQFRSRLKQMLYPQAHASSPSSTSSAHKASSPPISHSSSHSHRSPQSYNLNDNDKPLHPALLATVIAWGAKFSEHPWLVQDRDGANGQSRLARTLVNRAREVAEAEKVHRIPTVDHVVIALLIEPLQNQTPDDPDGFHGFWLTCAIRHLLDLQINHKSVMSNIQDPESRGTMIFAWWMACLADAYHSAYYRRKPQLDDEDYDIDFYTVDPLPAEMSDGQGVSLSPREQYEFLGYYRAAHALARIARNASKQLWRPTTESDGIPFDVLCTIMQQLNEWRDEHLPRVGVPSDFEAEWDFVSAVSACASDATFHVMWVIVFNAVDDFGIKEQNDVARAGSPVPNDLQIESVKHKLAEEALHGALRIAGLTGVLTSNGYLKLDPAVMHFSCLTAGTLLARVGRPEVSNCVGGLKQYSYAYDEAVEESIEMERTYHSTLSGESDINHMGSVVVPPLQRPQSMVIDQPGFSI